MRLRCPLWTKANTNLKTWPLVVYWPLQLHLWCLPRPEANCSNRLWKSWLPVCFTLTRIPWNSPHPLAHSSWSGLLSWPVHCVCTLWTLWTEKHSIPRTCKQQCEMHAVQCQCRHLHAMPIMPTCVWVILTQFPGEGNGVTMYASTLFNFLYTPRCFSYPTRTPTYLTTKRM